MNFMVHSWLMFIEEATYVRIEHPVHPLPLDARCQRIQRLMGLRPGRNP
jgi:hypothetical protein